MVQNMLRTLRSKAKAHCSSVAIEHRAVMDEARAVEQHIDRAGLLGQRADGGLVEDVEQAWVDGACGSRQFGKRVRVDVGGNNTCSFSANASAVARPMP